MARAALALTLVAVPSSGRPSVTTGEKAGIDSASDMVVHSWRLIAVERGSGRIAWDREVHVGMPRFKRHVKASHASATPATDGRSIVRTQTQLVGIGS